MCLIKGTNWVKAKSVDTDKKKPESKSQMIYSLAFNVYNFEISFDEQFVRCLVNYQTSLCKLSQIG